jgi:VWFA-related protein
MKLQTKCGRSVAVTSLLLVWATQLWSGQAQDQPEGTSSNKISVTVNTVLVPVVVRDAQGNAIGNLKKEDFEVFDKNKPQAIVRFDIKKRSGLATDPIRADGTSRGSNSLDAAEPKAIPPERFVVFLFDDVHLSAGDLSLIQRAGTKITSESLADSDMAAVVATSGVSSGLTRDHAKLQEAIRKLRMGDIYRRAGRACPEMTYYEADRILNKHDFMTLETAIEDTLACCDCKRDLAEVLAQNAAAENLHVGDQDVRQTLGFIREIVRKMGAMPGERTLVLISPGFLTATPEAMAGKSEVLDMAAKSNVTINALDARGLYATAVDAAEQNRGASVAERNAAQYRGYSMTLNEDVMAELAYGTGGSFFHNSNDLEGGLQRLTVVPEWVYLLQLTPTGIKQDGSYHALQVKVQGEGLKVEARRGYFAFRPSSAKTKK